MAEHFAEEHEFRIRCCCGRVFSETTEARARDRFEMHRIMSGEAGSGNAPTPATSNEVGSGSSPADADVAGAPPPPTVPELMEALEQSVNAAKAARRVARDASNTGSS